MTSGRCQHPRKDKLTQSEARATAAALNRRVPNTVHPYPCADHWHVGNPRVRNRRTRSSRGRANRRTAW